VANVQAGHLNLEEIKEIEVPVEEVDKYRLQPGDVVMTEGGDPDKLGRGTVWNGEIDLCLHQNHIFRVRPNVEMLDSHYLKAYLGSKSAQKYFLRCAKQTTGIASINKTQLRAFPVPLPPIEEQRRIAAILDKADAVRRKRKEAIALTEELLRSAFLEMFGDPVTNPKGWEIVELEQVCHRVTDGTHQSPEWVTEGIPFLFVSNIVEGEIDFNVSKYISEESWVSLTARCPIEVNDILYTTVGSYGNAALVRTEKRFCFQRHIAHIKPDSKKIHPKFLLGLMQSEGIRQQADRQVRGVAQKTLNLRELKKFQVAVPPRNSQEQYVAFRTRIEGCLNNQRDSFATQSNLFNSLLQRAFCGEL